MRELFTRLGSSLYLFYLHGISESAAIVGKVSKGTPFKENERRGIYIHTSHDFPVYQLKL